MNLSGVGIAKLMTFLDVAGAQGGPYRFQMAGEGDRVSVMGGEYLYVKADARSWEIVFAAESNNLSADAHRRWQEAVSQFGANRLYTRLNVAAAARDSELADILAQYQPPMNRSA